jgi:ankyrin repeat protein
MKKGFAILLITFSYISLAGLTSLKAQNELSLNDQLLLHADSANFEEALLLLKLGANPNTSTWDGTTALMYASESGSYKFVRELIARGADINVKPWSGNTALHSAVVANHDSIAELLILNGAEIDATNNYGVTPLHFASAYGYPFMVHLLLYYGASIDTCDSYGNTPLILSVYSGAYLVTQLLLEEWANVDKQDKQGFTPLMIAAQYNDTLMLRLLTDYGASIDKYNVNQATALALAISSRAKEAADFLISMGATKGEFHPSTSYAQLAKENGLISTYYELIRLGSSPFKKPLIRSTSMYFGSTFNRNDFYMLIGADAIATTFGVKVGLNYGIRPYYKSILVEEEEVSFQFNEIRHLIALALEKNFLINQNLSGRRFYFFVGINGIYSWGRYDYYKARTKPKDYILFSPGAGFTIQKNSFFLKTSGNMVRMEHLKPQPIMVNLSLGYIMNIAKPKIKQKSVTWY